MASRSYASDLVRPGFINPDFTRRVDLKFYTITIDAGEKASQCGSLDADFSQCDICDAAFIEKRSLKYHQMTHIGEKSLKSELCDAAFIRKCDFKSHMRTQIEKPFQYDL
ncbi:uncharacterized protein LOC143031411 isoform X2 [Oratosquilla oratoria]|uniref:uncharacterized protein LOC143031411 isoform X2 n=1 Tax=Oratosquilla oratoria TaxID=337810 RepID=UPI003F75D0EB